MCEDCQDTGRLWNMTCHCQATSELTRTCIKCRDNRDKPNKPKPLTSEFFEPVEETICNRGFSWHCKECLRELRAM